MHFKMCLGMQASLKNMFSLDSKQKRHFIKHRIQHFTVAIFNQAKIQKDAQKIFGAIHGWKEEILEILELVAKCLSNFFYLNQA